MGAVLEIGDAGYVLGGHPLLELGADEADGVGAALVKSAADADNGGAGHEHFDGVLAVADAAGADDRCVGAGFAGVVNGFEGDWFEGGAADAAAAVGEDGLAAEWVKDEAGHRIDGAERVGAGVGRGLGDATDAGNVGGEFDDDGDGLPCDGLLYVAGDGGGGVGAGGEGFAEAVLDVGAGDVDLEKVGIGRGDATSDVSEFGGRAGKDTGNDGYAPRLEARFRLPEQPDFLIDTRVRQTDRIEEAAAPVDAGGVDVAFAWFGAAALGCDGTAAFCGSAFEQADGGAPDAACQYERRGEFAVEEGDWQVGKVFGQFGYLSTELAARLPVFPSGDGQTQRLTNLLGDMAGLG